MSGSERNRTGYALFKPRLPWVHGNAIAVIALALLWAAGGIAQRGVGAQGLGPSQGHVENVDFEHVAGGVVNIYYDLIADSQDAAFTITLRASDDGGKTFDLRPSAITGDVANVKPGPRKKIVWRSGQDVAVLAFELVKFDAVATFVPTQPSPTPAPAPAATPVPTPAPTPEAARTPSEPVAPPRFAEPDAQVQRSIEIATYEIAKASNSPGGWEGYLAKYPNGAFADEARRAITSLQAAAERQRGEPAAYLMAESQNTEQAWDAFVKAYPTSQFAPIAQVRLDALRKTNRDRENGLYAKAVQTDRPEDWDALMKEFPTGRFVGEALTKKADAVRRVDEDTALLNARTKDTLGAWNAYLEKYPGGGAAADARRRIDQLTWLEAADLKPLLGGSFIMGNAKGEDDERPQHRVELDPFRIGRTEVTNGFYQKFLADTKRPRPSDPDFAKDYLRSYPDLPVVNVTYQDALAFCKWLSEKTGAGVRLPTEAEWEYAAVGGRGGRAYPWGDGAPAKFARFKENSPSGVKTVGKDAFPPNDVDLRNMAGNVAEWVSDYYSDDAYLGGVKKNPTGPPAGKERVVRGGSFESSREEIRATRRDKAKPDKAESWLGFRIVVK